MWLLYLSAREEETERAFDPYGLVYRAGRCTRWAGATCAGGCASSASIGCSRPAAPGDVYPAGRLRQRRLPPALPGQHPLRLAGGGVLLEVPLEVAQRRVPPVVATLDEKFEGVLRAGTDDLD